MSAELLVVERSSQTSLTRCLLRLHHISLRDPLRENMNSCPSCQAKKCQGTGIFFVEYRFVGRFGLLLSLSGQGKLEHRSTVVLTRRRWEILCSPWLFPDQLQRGPVII